MSGERFALIRREATGKMGQPARRWAGISKEPTMKKNLGQKNWIFSMPVRMVGTYDGEGRPNFMPARSFRATPHACSDKDPKKVRRVGPSPDRWLLAVAVAASLALSAAGASPAGEEFICPDPSLASDVIEVSLPAPVDCKWDNSAEAAVLRALKWFQFNQSQDGAWGNSEIPADRVACASLGLLAFLAHGETVTSEQYGETVMRALKFLLDSQNDNGEFVSTEDAAGTYAQTMAVYAVGEAFGMMRISELRSSMEKGLQVLIDGQHDRGGFTYGFSGSRFGDAHDSEERRKQLPDRRDTALSAWCCQAMKAAWVAGASNPGLAEAMEKAAADLRRAFCPDDGGFFADGTIDKPGGKRDFTTTAMAVFALQLLGHGRDNEVRQGLQFLQAARCDWDHPGGWPMQGWYFITKARFFAGGTAWTKWNHEFASQFVQRQTRNENPAENGAWVSPGTSLFEGYESCEDSARAYATALAALTLQNHFIRSFLLHEDYTLPEDDEAVEILIL